MSHRCRTGCTKRSYDRFEGLDGIRTFAEGYLCSVRISDYAGHEGEIDWTRTKASKEEAYSINLVDEFHGGCGMKEQEEY